MQQTIPSRDLVLVGAGHTNMHIVRMWRMKPIEDVQLTLVSPFSRATYSGMLPGVLAGLYQREEMEIDLYRFASSCGVKLIVASAIGLDPKRRRILLNDRPEVRYDVAAIGIGSVPKRFDLWGENPTVLSIKPMATFPKRLEEQVEGLACGSHDRSGAMQICVVGAGAGGIEVTFAVNAFLRKRNAKAALAVLDGGPRILEGYAPSTIEKVHQELQRQGIRVQCNRQVESIDGGQLRFSDQTSMPVDLTIWAVSAAPPPVLENFHLPKAEDGFLAVRSTLKTSADYSVFSVGDTATIVDHPVRKAGVYAVREGPILWENLQRTFAGQTLLEYKPQSGFLSLLSTGDGRAIGEYKNRTSHGRWVWKWKDYIDRKFMRKYQDYRPMDPSKMNGQAKRASLLKKDATPMRCRGCGGKVGANVLAAALERLPLSSRKDVVQGLNQPDDAAILDPSSGAVEVVSVDFFQAFLDDPYMVGRVAALNSLSDLWAMGSRPTGALAMATIPGGEPRQQAEVLYQLLAGGVREIQAAGAVLLGGHTTEGEALTIGYTVLGQLANQPPFTKAGLRMGDHLVLTKPLGSGVLLAAHGYSQCRAQWMDGLLENMLISNEAGAKVAREFQANAATDVTGFGLAGHLMEMLDASELDARIRVTSLPLLSGFHQLAEKGVRSSLFQANRQVAQRMEFLSGDYEDHRISGLFDPQTSGGLLVGIPGEKASAFVARLRENGYPLAMDIGHTKVRAGDQSSIIVD